MSKFFYIFLISFFLITATLSADEDLDDITLEEPSDYQADYSIPEEKPSSTSSSNMFLLAFKYPIFLFQSINEDVGFAINAGASDYSLRSKILAPTVKFGYKITDPIFITGSFYTDFDYMTIIRPGIRYIIPKDIVGVDSLELYVDAELVFFWEDFADNDDVSFSFGFDIDAGALYKPVEYFGFGGYFGIGYLGNIHDFSIEFGTSLALTF